MSVWESTEYFSTGRPPQRLGSANRMTAPYQVLRTADGYLTVAANSQKSWELLCTSIDRLDLVSDVRFASNADRMDHRAELAAELERTFTSAGTDSWVQSLLSAGLPCGPILDYQQILDGDPHAAARGMVQEIEHPRAGLLRVLGSPLKLSGTPVRARMPPPLLGAHTREVFDALTPSSTAAALADG
jgi:crotonobetainyl-CoA:carnitine CoA-transferase CaiB-like acyl-CoA transferase